MLDFSQDRDRASHFQFCYYLQFPLNLLQEFEAIHMDWVTIEAFARNSLLSASAFMYSLNFTKLLEPLIQNVCGL